MQANIWKAQGERREEHDHCLKAAEEANEAWQQQKAGMMMAEAWLDFLPCCKQTKEAAAAFFKEATLYVQPKHQILEPDRFLHPQQEL